MKFCPVIPPTIDNWILPSPPRGMFAFAPWCMQERPYEAFYRVHQATALQTERGPLVIDCPIYEGGMRLDVPELRLVETRMKPDFIIVPDVRQDMAATVDLFHRYARRLGDAATGVLQGNTWIELDQCFKEMLDAGCKRFAIPKDVLKIDVYRSDLALQMASIAPDIQIHLLGGDWPYVDEAKAGKQTPQVISFDSAEPFNAAYADLDLAKAAPPARPRDWLKTPNILGDGFVRLFHGNIEVVERLSRCQ